MATDEDDREREIKTYKSRLNLLSDQVQTYEQQIKYLQTENKTLKYKLNSAEKDAITIRSIMTNNITQSNEKEQNLHKEIDLLKKELVELKEKLRDLSGR